MSSPAWPALEGIAYGGDYTPEQWPREVWDDDIARMRDAGVNLVSVGIFAWGLIERREGEFTFSWLDEIIERLFAAGIRVDLGTPTASPPAWFFETYPEARAVTADGVPLGFGSRGMAAPTSPEYRAAAVRIATVLAERYGEHPGVVMWHVHNEYGVPIGQDFSVHAVAAWRVWLQERYATLDALNAAWGTAFWGQHYEAWSQIGAPAKAASVLNPAQKLDFARFSDEQLRVCFRAERDAIRAHSTRPITTNFMANQHLGCDLWAWAQEVDLVSDDHYLWTADPNAHIGLSIAADLTRSVAGRRPWLLMEHSTSAVNWQPRNIAKRPGEMARNSLTHLARGADGILFFQWRASRSGAEKFHSAMLPHAGAQSRVFREVVALGEALRASAPVRGTTVAAEVAILWDFESFWAQDLEWRPSSAVHHNERVRSFYEQLWRNNITADFALPGHDLSRYRLVVVPAQYLLRAEDADNLNRYVEAGGTLVVSFFSGIVDEHDAIHPGGFGRVLEPALGVWIEEHLPMREGETADLAFGDHTFTSDLWQEDLVVTRADVRGTYRSGPGVGIPGKDAAAITRNTHGTGVGWYLSTRLDAEGLATVMAEVYRDAGITPAPAAEGVELVRRQGEDAEFVFAINHSDADADLAVAGVNLFTGRPTDSTLTLPAGGVALVRTDRPSQADAP